ncbi:hypothetical protein C6A37_11660, partial [Desulfobacteraceae bacterium SEEP-SAG9]
LEQVMVEQIPSMFYKKKRVIPTPQDTYEGEVEGFDGRKNELLMVTNFDYFEKLQGIINYWDQIIDFLNKNKDFKLTILGDGIYQGSIKNKLNNKLNEQIFFRGFKK